jgi:hypothetical protein
MKILHIYKDYSPVLGGIENHIRILAEAQAARGHVVTVLVANPQRRTIDDTLNDVRVIKAARWATIASTPISSAMFRQEALELIDDRIKAGAMGQAGAARVNSTSACRRWRRK